jgi:hypothetical protein
MSEKTKEILSWISVIPGSLMAGIIIRFPVHWILYRTLSGGESPFVTPYPELPETLLAPFFAAMVVIWVSAELAPRYKFNVAIFMTVLWTFIAGGAFTLGYIGYEIPAIKFKLVAGGLPIAIGILGSLVSLYIVKRRVMANDPITL